MALASDIMTGGFSAVSAQAIQGQVNSAVTAAGTTQATATALTRSNSIVTAGSGGGVVLKSADVADEQEILNLSGGNVTVYPPGSERINGLAAAAGFLLANNTAVKVKKYTSTRWGAFLSA